MELCGAWLPIELAGATGEGFRWGAFNFPTVEGGQGSRHDLEAGIVAFMITKASNAPLPSISALAVALDFFPPKSITKAPEHREYGPMRPKPAATSSATAVP